MTAIQIKRMANDPDYPSGSKYDDDDLGEIGQFLSSLLMYQGITDVNPTHIQAVLPKLKVVMRKYKAGFAGETSERCYDYLKGDECVLHHFIVY